MTDRELMQQALNVLKIFVDGGNSAWARKIIEIKEALRDRLAEPEQEHSEQWWKHEVSNAWAQGYEKGRLQREWQGLTDEEIERLYLGSFDEGQFARAIEAKLKEKNT